MLTRSQKNKTTLDDVPRLALVGHDQRDELSDATNAIDLRELWRVVRWRARLIALAAIGAMAITAVGLAALPPKYKGTTVILIDPRQARVTNSEQVLSGIGNDAAAVESQVELIESSELTKKVIATANLAADPEFNSPSAFHSLRQGVLSIVGLGTNESAEAQTNRLIYKFKSGLTVFRRGLTYIIEVSYSANDPEKAARISRAVAQAYLDDQRDAKMNITARASTLLGGRIEELRERVRQSESAVADYKSANRIIDVTQGNKLIGRQIEDMTQQLALARTRTADARGRLERVQQITQQKGDLATLGEALQSQVISNLRTQQAESARLAAEYSALYGDRHPALVAVRAQMADIRQQIDREVARILVGVRNEFQVAISRETSLEAELSKLKDQSESFGQADVKLRELEREAQANRTLFEQFLGRVKETSEEQGMQIPDARIVSPALTPQKAERPAAILLLIVAGIFGTICAIAFLLLLERTRRGFRRPSEVEQVLSLPSIGILPDQPELASAGPMSQWQRLLSQLPRLQAAPRPADNSSPYAENLKAIARQLRRGVAKTPGEVLVVLSALPGEGKSTFARNFALASASSGMRTLLIDGDIYTGSATRTFDVRKPGLCEVLDNKTTIWEAVFQHKESGLYVLGARNMAFTPEAITINESALAALLTRCRQRFDLIVIDSPAILPFDGDTFIKCADRALLIVEWERTERPAVLEALAMLGENKEKVAGVVLNKVSTYWYQLFDYGRYPGYATYTESTARS
jgi:succinoglycan biosynthesis transport protein ExoP